MQQYPLSNEEAILATVAESDPEVSLPATANETHVGPGQNKQLRVLVYQSGHEDPDLSLIETGLIDEFAAERDLAPVWVPFHDSNKLTGLLEQGDENVIITARAALNAKVDDQVMFTFPWGVSFQQVVARKNTGRMDGLDDLSTRQVYIKKSSPAWPVLASLAQDNPGMDLVPVAEDLDLEVILQRVASGQFDVAVLESLQLDSRLHQYLDLAVALNISTDEAMSWAVKAGSEELYDALNRFIARKQLEMNVAQAYREDLAALQERKLLRLITYQSPVNYFFDRGKLKGFEYELARRFARDKKMRLDVVIANSHEEMETLLLQGKGDVIAAALPAGSFGHSDGVEYTRPYNYAAPTIIGRTLDSPLIDSRDLAGRSIILPLESAYREELERIQASGVDVEIIQAEPGDNMESILFQVSRGDYDLTILSSHQLRSELGRHLNLKAHFSLSDPAAHVWATRESDTQLLTSLNEFIDKQFRMAFYNVLYVKYIEKPVVQNLDMPLLTRVDSLSPYDEIVYKYAQRYSFDWRLIVAQMYQESHFNPEARSYAGAEGLMQLIPDTADLLGIEDTNDPHASIYGGIKYLDYLRGRFEPDLPVQDRTWFALAAYNAGYNRVKKARILAEKMSLDKNRWFNNVEKAMLALSKPYRKNGEWTRYCRCGQTTYYVREIKTLYSNYIRLTGSERVASADMQPAQDI